MKAERAKVRTGPEIEAEVPCRNQDHVLSLGQSLAVMCTPLSACVSEPLACYSVSLKDSPAEQYKDCLR